MLKLSMILSFLFLAINANARGSLKDLDSKYGFRDLKFGMQVKDLPKVFLKISEDSGFSVYTRPTDKMQVGRAKLTELKYMFFDGAFCAVGLKTASSEDTSNLFASIVETYGPWKRIISYVNFNNTFGFQIIPSTGKDYYWETDNIIMHFMTSPSVDEGTLTIWSKKYIELWQERKREFAKNSWKDL